MRRGKTAHKRKHLEPWISGLSSHKNKVIAQLEALASDLSNVPADVTFVLDSGDEVHGNKTIIAARSAVFRTMLFGEMREGSATTVKLSDISLMCLKAVIQWSCTGCYEGIMKELMENDITVKACMTADPALDVNDALKTLALNAKKEDDIAALEAVHGSYVGLLCEILVASDKYAMALLTKVCVQDLSANLNIDNATDVLLCASAVNASALKDICLRFIVKNRKEVYEAGGFHALSKELVVDVLMVDETFAPLNLFD